MKNEYENATAFNNCLFNVSNLKAGIYTAEIEVNQYRYTQKIIVK